MMNIRMATKDDVEIFVKLRIGLFKELGEITQNTDIDELEVATKEYYEENINHNFICWLAEYNGEVIASSGLNIFQRLPYEGNLHGLEGFILNIYTLPQYRKRGVATNIVQEIINYSKETRIKRLWLHASDEGSYVYSKLGFKFKDSEMELVW